MSYRNRYLNEVIGRLMPIREQPLLAMEDILTLPDIVRKYLVYVNAVGNPKIQNVRTVWEGSMKRTRKSGWMKIRSQQYNFFDDPARFFYIHARLMGIPFEGLHMYIGTEATMQIKVASLFRVADAKGEKMSHGETVTVFNDMCFLAPSTLAGKNIRWEPVDEFSVKATYTNGNIRVSAILLFNEKGELINFISDDRFYCKDGKTYIPYRWSTPIRDYIETGGRRVPSFGEAVWHTPDGEYSYARFILREIEYNISR